MSQIGVAIGRALGDTFAIIYGLLTLIGVLIYTAFHKETWYGRSEAEDEHFKTASQELWSLSNAASPIAHNFLRLPEGPQLHYLSQKNAGGGVDTLVILVHGFPDSAFIWDRQLRGNPPSSSTKIVALDLPGCGGSDNLKSYGSNQVLNAMAEAIVQLKIRYLETAQTGAATPTPKRKCILVGHDWGGVLSYRIAAETVGLVDNVVTLNSVYPIQAAASVRARLARGFEAFREWFTRFYEFSKLEEAGEELGPVFSQMGMSSYIFLVTLPLPLAKIFPAVSNTLVRYCHKLTHTNAPEISEVMFAASLALSNGPSTEEAQSGSEGAQYGPSVLARSQAYPAGDWDQRVRLYKEGAALDRWTPNYTGSRPDMRKTQTAPAPKPDPVKKYRLVVRESQKFKCPVNIIYGLNDIALNPRITLDGIEEYFVSEPDEVQLQRIVKLPECSHWSLTEDAGVKALHKTLVQLTAER